MLFQNLKLGTHAPAKMATYAFTLFLASIAHAKDLYVATNGSDAVSYSTNSISTPWKSLNHAMYNLQAGDHLYIRGGTYKPNYPIFLADDYTSKNSGGDPTQTMSAQSGTSSQTVIIENYNSETVTVDLSSMTDSFIYLDNKSYWTFRGLNFVNSLQVFMVGENSPTKYITFENLNVVANRGGDNRAAIHLENGNADYITVKGCNLTGPGQAVHQNTSTIYANRTMHLSVLNNTLSNAPIGIYFKLPHSATSSSQTALEVAGNKFSSTGRASIENNTAYVNIHDNAFGGGSTYINLGEDFRGDSNIIAHNTFLDGSVNVLATTATNNTIANNIIMKSLIVLRYVSTSISTTLQRNLYTSSSSLLSMTTKMESTALVGTPMFVGGANPSTLPQYALASTSIGRAAATDGTDIGLRVTSTSSSPTAPATTSPPSAPSLSVQIQ